MYLKINKMKTRLIIYCLVFFTSKPHEIKKYISIEFIYNNSKN